MIYQASDSCHYLEKQRAEAVLHENKLVQHHFQRIVYRQTAINKRHSTLTPKTASLFLFTDFTDILLNVNVALIDVVSLVVNVFNKKQNKTTTIYWQMPQNVK